MATSATSTKIGDTQVSLPSDREVVVTRAFDAPRQLVFDAWTKPEHVTRWMLGPEGWTMPLCEIDLRPGGKWRFGWAKEGEQGFEMEGEYREVSPPDRLVWTERWGGDWPEALNTLVLTEEGGRTTTTCTILFPSKEARDRALGTGMSDGMAVSYDRLAELLRRMA